MPYSHSSKINRMATSSCAIQVQIDVCLAWKYTGRMLMRAAKRSGAQLI